jgi:hypothetical protein
VLSLDAFEQEKMLAARKSTKGSLIRKLPIPSFLFGGPTIEKRILLADIIWAKVFVLIEVKAPQLVIGGSTNFQH